MISGSVGGRSYPVATQGMPMKEGKLELGLEVWGGVQVRREGSCMLRAYILLRKRAKSV